MVELSRVTTIEHENWKEMKIEIDKTDKTKFANFWNFDSFPNWKNSEYLVIFQVVKF